MRRLKLYNQLIWNLQLPVALLISDWHEAAQVFVSRVVLPAHITLVLRVQCLLFPVCLIQ